MLHQIKAHTFVLIRVSKEVFNPPVNVKIQGLFKAFQIFLKYFSKQIKFSRTFQDSPVYSSTFQACANPVILQPKMNRKTYTDAFVILKFHIYW